MASHHHLLPAVGSQHRVGGQHTRPDVDSSDDEIDPSLPSRDAGLRASANIPIPRPSLTSPGRRTRRDTTDSQDVHGEGSICVISLADKVELYPGTPQSHGHRASSLSSSAGRIRTSSMSAGRLRGFTRASYDSTHDPVSLGASRRSGVGGEMRDATELTQSRKHHHPKSKSQVGFGVNDDVSSETDALLGDLSQSHEYGGGQLDGSGRRRGGKRSWVDACCPAVVGRCADAATAMIRPVVMGLINGVIVLPVMVGYAQIVFKDPFFTPYMPNLVNLMLFSAAIHQLGFSLKSTLHFAIGSVQDAGLIFLSTMSSSIVQTCKARNAADADILATVLCWLAMSTALLGLALIVTGKLKLASLVQYLPLPVVGGYLAFIGLYCLEAALGVMAGQDIAGPADYHKLLHSDLWILIAPGIVSGILLLLVVQRFTHPAALPAALLGIPLAFYIVVLAGGWSMPELRSAYGVGWLAPNDPEPPFYETWAGFKFDRIQWYAIPKQLPTWFTMFVVVAFSSSLDVAAIQMELGRPLDFNAELQTVGVANVLSGLTGGYTGSYIFSQTIFTMRSGIQSRMVGVVIIPFLLLMFCLPFSLQAFVPTFFFGAVLVFIAFDLLLEWLWHARSLVARSEYAIILITFATITATTLIVGFAVGCGCCVLHFLFLYARSPHVAKQPATSSVSRGFKQRRILAVYRKAIVVHRLSGYIFFGSAVSILASIKESIKVHDDANEALENDADAEKTNGGERNGQSPRRPTLRRRHSSTSSLRKVPEDDDESQLTHFLLLDFEAVNGVDATAARSLFVTLVQTCHTHGIVLVATGIASETRKLLACHGVLEYSTFKEFNCLDEGLKFCEDGLLAQIDPALHPQRLTPHDESLEGILSAYLAESSSFPDPTAVFASSKPLGDYFTRVTLEKGELLFEQGDPGESVYLISHGAFLLRRHAKYRTGHYGQGGIIGDLDFFSNSTRSFSAEAEEESIVHELCRADLNRLYTDDPRLATMVLHVILKSLSLSATQNRLILQRIV